MVIVFFWIIFGALAGWVCALIDDTLTQQQTIGYIVLGAVGALLSGTIIHLFNGQAATKPSISSFIFPTFGSILILYITILMRRQS